MPGIVPVPSGVDGMQVFEPESVASLSRVSAWLLLLALCAPSTFALENDVQSLIDSGHWRTPTRPVENRRSPRQPSPRPRKRFLEPAQGIGL